MMCSVESTFRRGTCGENYTRIIDPRIRAGVLESPPSPRSWGGVHSNKDCPGTVATPSGTWPAMRFRRPADMGDITQALPASPGLSPAFPGSTPCPNPQIKRVREYTEGMGGGRD
jgi:hypothetical protein